MNNEYEYSFKVTSIDKYIEYCKKNNLIFETITFDKKSNEENYNEQELREKRYKYFEELSKKREEGIIGEIGVAS